MDIKSSEYLSIYTGAQIDNAISGIRDYEAELAQKVDKTTTVNGQPLSNDVNITAEDIGALSDEIKYGASINYENGYLDLVDQDGAVLESRFMYPNWGEIQGEDLSENAVLQAALDSKQDKITSESLLSSDLVDDTDKNHKFVTSAQLTQIATNTTDIATIESKIPSQATSENQLADKNFVNSSITSNTAYFIGTFNSVAELEAYSGTLTNNDYAFVQTTDTAGNTFYDRYKYNSSTHAWAFEYEINNSSFTANQWATLNSGLAANDKTQLDENTSAIASMTSTLNTFGNIVTHSVSEFATASQGSLADTALQPNDNITELNNNAGYISGIDSTDVITALGYTPEDSANKILTISVSSTDTQYPSAKAVYDELVKKQNSNTAVIHPVTTAVGDTTTPVYIDGNGNAVALNYSIQTSVPQSAVFTDTTYSAFVGADGTTAGTSGLVPQPLATDNDKYLRGDGSWSAISNQGASLVENNIFTGTNTFNNTVNLGSSANATTPTITDSDTSVATTAFARKLQVLQPYHQLTYSSNQLIDLNEMTSLYKLEPTGNITNMSFTNVSSIINNNGYSAFTFELYLVLNNLYTIAWPSNVSWLDGELPDLSSTGTYFFAFRTLTGSSWFGNMQGRWS